MGKKQTKRNASKRSPSERTTCQRNGSSRCENLKDGLKSQELKCQVDSSKHTADLFPRHSILIVFILTLFFRISYVSKVENWWILHPDEIFQSVEVAHSEFYGYGFRPYEYMPPLDGANTTSVGRSQENVLGMFSLRSFLYPKVLVLALYAASFCGYTGSPMLFWKIFHAVVTSCLPLAVYAFSGTLYKSRDVAVLASILSSTSVFLYVLGTHTLVNSFVSPFFFWALVPLFKLLTNKMANEQTEISKEQKKTKNMSRASTSAANEKLFPPQLPPLQKLHRSERSLVGSRELGKGNQPSVVVENISLVDKNPVEQEPNVNEENLHSENNKHVDSNKQQQHDLRELECDSTIETRNDDLENGTTKCSTYKDTDSMPKVATTHKLYTALPCNGNRLTNVHKGIIYEIMHHFTKPNQLSAPYLRYAKNTYMGGGYNHVPHVEEACYDQLNFMNCKNGVDFNSNHLQKTNNQSMQQRNPNRSVESKTESNSRNNLALDRNVLQKNDVTGSHSMKMNSDIISINTNTCEEDIGQFKTKTLTDSALATYDHKTNKTRENVSKQKMESNVKQEQVKDTCVDTRDCDQGSCELFHMMTYLFSGFVLSLCMYVRADLLIFVTLVILPYGKTISKCKLLTSLPFLLYCVGLISGVTFGIFDDYISYGTPVISPWQWFNFNILRDKSAIFFGKKHWSFYIRALFIQNEVMCIGLIVSVLTFIALKCKRIADRGQFTSTNTKLFISLLTFFIIHSLNSHKEVRFLHDFIVLLLIFYASFIVIIIKTYKQYLRHNSHLSHGIVVLLISYLITSQWRYFPSPASGWAFRGLRNTNNVNMCLDFLRQRNDVTGVFIDTSIHETGAFVTLHRNVPLIALIHNEFYEFDMDSRHSQKPVLPYVSRTNNLTLSVLTQVSDFISVYNTPYLLKTLINKPEYNYLVLQTDRPFMDVGFSQVYRAGDMKVLKRSFNPEDEIRLRTTGNKIPLGPSCKILDYEANWLLTFGLYDKAIKKLNYCLTLDKTNLPSYQLMREVRRRQGDDAGARDVYKMCGEYHGHQACTRRPGRIVLHQEYQINVDI
ncbi:uncharacterized protein [Argopecten irradians]|uniref:uncharacterized protein n=1 Tax=Argopecten irradians TaxID=31199 RepID=UPI00371DA313